ncbi:hypothetical protein NW762_007383 [Fusarium torreyae]|uniref:Autophagy-related protein 1 n=1 Tax=Fusarium torreyae TaxID=1237075 RepID=A0A9W8RZC3_9HYPO|nr:hypothetical protein NW762_007383 [Fusarium torreyae]
MTALERLPELVRDSYLEATLHPNEDIVNTTTHKTYTGRWRTQQEQWKRRKILVKQLDISGAKGKYLDYVRELEALATFSQGKVRLRFMHQNDFAHRDLKPANIPIKSKPLDGEWHVKICDLGLSKRVGTEKASTTAKGTPGFMAPEAISGIGLDIRTFDPFLADMWCFGETIFYMLTCKATFNNPILLAEYHKGDLEFPGEALEGIPQSGVIVDFIRKLMSQLPAERLTAEQAAAHPWMDAVLDFSLVSPETEITELCRESLGSVQWIMNRYSVAITGAGQKRIDQLFENNLDPSTAAAQEELSEAEHVRQVPGQGEPSAIWTTTVPGRRHTDIPSDLATTAAQSLPAGQLSDVENQVMNDDQPGEQRELEGTTKEQLVLDEYEYEYETKSFNL